MATEAAPETETATKTKLNLTPPDALQPVEPAEASGLVPLKKEETSELDKRVSQFVDELAALDANSPEFGKKVLGVILTAVIVARIVWRLIPGHQIAAVNVGIARIAAKAV